MLSRFAKVKMLQTTRSMCGFGEFKHTLLHTSKATVLIQHLSLFGPGGKQNNELAASALGLT